MALPTGLHKKFQNVSEKRRKHDRISDGQENVQNAPKPIKIVSMSVMSTVLLFEIEKSKYKWSSIKYSSNS